MVRIGASADLGASRHRRGFSGAFGTSRYNFLNTVQVSFGRKRSGWRCCANHRMDRLRSSLIQQIDASSRGFSPERAVCFFVLHYIHQRSLSPGFVMVTSGLRIDVDSSSQSRLSTTGASVPSQFPWSVTCEHPPSAQPRLSPLKSHLSGRHPAAAAGSDQHRRLALQHRRPSAARPSTRQQSCATASSRASHGTGVAPGPLLKRRRHEVGAAGRGGEEAQHGYAPS